MKLSIIMPAYNEEAWIQKIVKKVFDQDVFGITEKELIIVDDCSTDGSAEVIKNLATQFEGKIVTVFHQKNMGKGAAVRSAVERVTGDIVIIQDADLEYDPQDYSLLIEPIINGRADCVYGSRFVGTQSKRVLFYWHSLGNKFLTLISNMFTNINLTDMETCYKVFRAEVIKSIPLRSNRFGFEPEITAKIAKRKLRIHEVGIGYNGRTYDEGKKINWKDGVWALFIVFKYWLIDDSQK